MIFCGHLLGKKFVFSGGLCRVYPKLSFITIPLFTNRSNQHYSLITYTTNRVYPCMYTNACRVFVTTSVRWNVACSVSRCCVRRGSPGRGGGNWRSSWQPSPPISTSSTTTTSHSHNIRMCIYPLTASGALFGTLVTLYCGV